MIDQMTVIGSLVMIFIFVFAGRYLTFKSRTASNPSGISGFKMFGFLLVLGGFLAMFLLISYLLLVFYQGQFGILTVCAKSIFKLGFFGIVFPLALAYLPIKFLSTFFDGIIAKNER